MNHNHAIALQPGNKSETSSQKKKKKYLLNSKTKPFSPPCPPQTGPIEARTKIKLTGEESKVLKGKALHLHAYIDFTLNIVSCLTFTDDIPTRKMKENKLIS